MDELFVVILQILIEGAFETLPYIPFDFPVNHSGKKDVMFARYFLLFIFLGCLCGVIITLTISPNLLLPHAWMRISNLILGPLFSGYISYLIARKRKKSYYKIKPFNHAVYAFMFTLSFVLVRSFYAQR